MRSSSADALTALATRETGTTGTAGTSGTTGTARRLADRAGWTRLGAAVLLGMVAAVGPVIGQTSAQFTDTSEVALVSVGTPDDFASPTPSATPDGTTASTTDPGTGSSPTVGAEDPTTLARPSAGPGHDGPSPVLQRPRTAPFAR
ncbi:hypothetical protein [Cellulomonas sp.]|uniref:hypothetical protein n=1 Tax=Cellulomonas sp. TaxID=40001 RepID=UPI001B054E81|nr:hypothetical protein [Cellulomonas sp.]MBO9555945.1 hypothetical protein [Cellulomonas sp.]